MRPPFTRPVLLPADSPVQAIAFDTPQALAEHLHQLRDRRRLECSPGRASLEGEPDWPCLTIRAAPKTGDAEILGTVAGPGVDTLDALMTALRDTYQKAA